MVLKFVLLTSLLFGLALPVTGPSNNLAPKKGIFDLASKLSSWWNSEDKNDTSARTGRAFTTNSPIAVLPVDDCFGITTGCCQNFNEARQNAINIQINQELVASYEYMAMAAYFGRSEPNHPGFAKFFAKASVEEREHALKLTQYLNSRGGKVSYTSIKDPERHEWNNGLHAFEEALKLEKKVNEKLLALHELAEGDPHMQDYLENEFLTEQVDSIHEINGYISQLKRVRESNPGLGEFEFERRFL